MYIGNYRDSKDRKQIDAHNITHILAIHENPRRLLAVSNNKILYFVNLRVVNIKYRTFWLFKIFYFELKF